MASLTTLPQELLITIINYVRDQTALYNLMRCSRYLYSTVLPFAFHNVEIHHPGFHMLETSWNCHFFQLVYDFTIQMLQGPQRASLVKSFTAELETCRFPLLKAVDASIEKYIDRSQCTTVEGISWVAGIKEASIDALFAILLPSLPQLECLEFAVPLSSPHCTRMLMDAMGQGKKDPDRPFQNLRRLGGGGKRLWLWAELWPHQLAHFLRMPSMESIAAKLYLVNNQQAQCEMYIDPSWELTTLQRGSSNVTSLELQSCHYDVKEMTCAIAACRNLKTLKIKLRHVLEEISVSKFAGLTAAITQASQTLETLEFIRNRYTCIWSDETISSLHDRQCQITTAEFPKLQDLTLNMLSIFGPRLVHDRRYFTERPRPGLREGIPDLLPGCLPPQIEKLHFIICESEDDTPLIYGVEVLLRRVRGGQFDRLTHLRVDYPNTMVEGHRDENWYHRSCLVSLEDFRILAKSLGIRFESNLLRPVRS